MAPRTRANVRIERVDVPPTGPNADPQARTQRRQQQQIRSDPIERVMERLDQMGDQMHRMDTNILQVNTRVRDLERGVTANPQGQQPPEQNAQGQVNQQNQQEAHSRAEQQGENGQDGNRRDPTPPRNNRDRRVRPPPRTNNTHQVEIPEGDLATQPRAVTQAARAKSPFIPAILASRAPPKFHMPTMKLYDGTTDPADHIHTYDNLMTIAECSDYYMCRCFGSSLNGMARTWLAKLPPASITGFDDLAEKFTAHFMSQKRLQKTSVSLLSIKQKPDESLRDYVNRFNREKLKVANANPTIALAGMLQGLRTGPFFFEMSRYPPETMDEFLDIAEGFMEAEEAVAAKEVTDSLAVKPRDDLGKNKGSPSRANRGQSQAAQKTEPRGRSQARTQEKRARSRSPVRPNRPAYLAKPLTPLNTTPARILAVIEKQEDIQWPLPMRAPPNRRNMNKHCRFHNEPGHDTNDCKMLKEEIERLIQRGRLRRFISYPPHNKNRTERVRPE